MTHPNKDSTNTNPALGAIAFMEGKWDMELLNASFLPSKETVMHGDVSFRWIEGSALLVMRQELAMQQSDRDTQQFATWVFGRDESDGEEYTVFYYDDRKISRIYHMSFDGALWKIWRRPTPDSYQRFVGKVSDDRSVVDGHWEFSKDDGKTWQSDFSVKYIRK